MNRKLVFVLLITAFLPQSAAAECTCPASDVRIIGHRGAGSSAEGETPVENTIESAQQAFVEGAEMVEVDVQTSADGAVVLMHDDTVDRTTEGTGCVAAMTLEELRALSVPTLGELLAAVDGPVNVEVKLHETDQCPAQDLNALADAVVEEIRGASAQERVLISSFDLDVLKRIRQTEPSIPIGYLTVSAADIDVVAAEGFEAINLLAIAAGARTVRQAHEAGIAVNVWTVNGQQNVTKALEAGVDGVITDTAAEAVAARTAYCTSYTCPDGGVDGGMGSAPSGGCSASPGTPTRGAWVVLALAMAFVTRRRFIRA
jgi:glycerophosphoryl diester phosphodiesterase